MLDHLEIYKSQDIVDIQAKIDELKTQIQSLETLLNSKTVEKNLILKPETAEEIAVVYAKNKDDSIIGWVGKNARNQNDLWVYGQKGNLKLESPNRVQVNGAKVVELGTKNNSLVFLDEVNIRFIANGGSTSKDGEVWVGNSGNDMNNNYFACNNEPKKDTHIPNSGWVKKYIKEVIDKLKTDNNLN